MKTQARERTQILMDLANKTNGLVVGTGDLSELALAGQLITATMSIGWRERWCTQTLVRVL